MSGELQKVDPQKAFDTLRTQLEKAAPKLQEVAPKHLKVERLMRLLLSACSRNPKILECTPASVLQFAMKCSETGLEPIGAGGAWPIPYENKRAGTVELTFIPDYRGLVNCAKRSDCVKDAYAEVVRQLDVFDYEMGLAPFLVHKPARGDRGELEAAYCVLVFPDDTKRFVVMDKAEIEAIRNRSQAWQSFLRFKRPCPWSTDAGEMWKKTVIRRAMKPFTGMSPQLEAAFAADDEAGVRLAADERAPIPMPKAIGDGAETPAASAQDAISNGQHEEEPKANGAIVAAIEDEIGRLNLTKTEIQAHCKEVGARGISTLRQSQAERLMANLAELAPADATE